MDLALSECKQAFEGFPMKTSFELLGETLQLTEKMLELADLGDQAREDVGCGVLYGFLRDSAFKIRKLAEQEKEQHMRRGAWPEKGEIRKGKSRH